VKHILINHSIFLLSSTLFGKEGGVLYQNESSSGFVWKLLEIINPNHFSPFIKYPLSFGSPIQFVIQT